MNGRLSPYTTRARPLQRYAPDHWVSANANQRTSGYNHAALNAYGLDTDMGVLLLVVQKDIQAESLPTPSCRSSATAKAPRGWRERHRMARMTFTADPEPPA